MSTTLNPYLGFRDNAREAMDFYHRVFGGELTISTFEQFQVSEDPAEANKVMHATLVTEAGLTLMAADAPNSMPYDSGSAISISLSGTDARELRGYFAALADGGQVTVPLETQQWGDEFGMLTDRFGVSWMVNIAAA